MPHFEQQVASYCGIGHAVAVNSATSALHIACMALGVGPGDRVWTSPNTFVASANCARYCGAEVDFVDIDHRTWNLCPKRLAEKLASEAGVKFVCCTSLCSSPMGTSSAASPVDMAAIHAGCAAYGFRV